MIHADFEALEARAKDIHENCYLNARTDYEVEVHAGELIVPACLAIEVINYLEALREQHPKVFAELTESPE